MASINYTGKFENGTVFDSNVLEKFGHVHPYTFITGTNRVIPCLDYSVEQMSPESEATVFCPSKTAYGSKKVGPIKPNSNLIF